MEKKIEKLAEKMLEGWHYFYFLKPEIYCAYDVH